MISSQMVCAQISNFKCMAVYLKYDTEYGWYLYLNGDEIIARMDVIDNDFHNRKNLFSNVCGI